VETAPLSEPKIPIIGNVTAQPLTSITDIRADLQAQLYSRVRWTESIQFMCDQGVDTFIELGSGNVLTGLVKRIDRAANRYSIGKPEDFEAIVI
jgi:[acyl-carrier-protein] S-malonyltransferase